LVNKPRLWMQSLLTQNDVTVEHFYPNSNSKQPLTLCNTLLKPFYHQKMGI